MKRIFTLTLFLCLVSCNKENKACSQQSADPSSSAQQDTCVVTETPPVDDGGNTTPDPSGGDVSSDAFSTNADLSSLAKSDSDKVLRALSIIRKVVQTQEFKDRVKNFVFDGQKQFANNDNLSNSEILQKVYEAEEIHVPGKNHVMEFEYDLYYTWSSTVGYGTPSDNVIHTNTKYFYSMTDAELAGHIFHEWLHKIGFEHDYYATAQRPYSVPYALGDLIEELGGKI